MLASSLCSVAQEESTNYVKALVVTTTDGAQTRFPLKEKPQLTIEKPYLVVNVNGTCIDFELEEMLSLKYINVPVVLGDAYEDGVVNSTDVTTMANYIIGKRAAGFSFSNADANNDETVNIADIVTTGKHIINSSNKGGRQSRSHNAIQRASSDGSGQRQHALYNYRNDGDFDAWLNVDIDNITYSKIDTLGIEHEDFVVQEVRTPYQVYRIPIEAIDSIGFHAPETKYNEKVFFITDSHIPYIKIVDDLSITFDNSTPEELLPVVGQILVAETSEDPLEDGFAGRIVDITDTDAGKEFICEEVSLSDIFDRILFISKCATSGELDEENSRTRTTIDIDEVVKIDLDPIDIEDGDEDENKDKIPMTMRYQPEMSITCFVNVVKDKPAIAKITFRHAHSLYFRTKYEKEFPFTKEWWFGKKDIRIHIPIKAVDAVIKPYIRFGAFIDADCKINFEYTLPYLKFEHTFGLDYNEARPDDNRVQFINDAELTAEDPTMKLSVDGSLAFGLAVKLGANLIHKRLLNFESTFHIGPKLSGHFDLYTGRVAEDANLYRQLKTATLQLNGYVAMTKATYQYFGSGVKLAKRGSWKGATWTETEAKKTASWLSNDLFPDGLEFTWYINKWNLLPHFDPPTVTEVTSNSALASIHPFQNLIFPVELGVAFQKYSTGEVIEYDYGSYWGEKHNKETKYEHLFDDLEASITYKVYPTVKFNWLGLKMDAEPSTDYTVSDKLLISPKEITIRKGETAEIIISGGSGKYSTIDDDPKIARSLSINYNQGVTTGQKAALTILGVDEGETYISIYDTGNASNCILKVKVLSEDAVLLSLSSTSLSLEAGKQGTVEITSGSGNYTAESSDTDVATVKINNGCIEVTAVKAGTATITVTDTENNQTATVEVTVKEEETPYIPVKTETFVVNGVSFTMVGVEGGSFMMGSPDDDSEADSSEKPSHQVTLSSFAIGETEVTQALWQAVMGSNPSPFEDDINCPVEMVNWEDCQTFISKLNSLTGRQFHLPTEAQWEYAARGGNKSLGYKYSGSNDIGSVAWWGNNSGNLLHIVKTKAPNELGIYDMSGNVCEWCSDWYGSYSSESQTNPTGPSSGRGRVVRGGFSSSGTNLCRSTCRGSGGPSDHNSQYGLRLALSGDDNNPDQGNHEWVDLGLPSGTLWATCNVGANSPWEYGGYYAWGETEEKEEYNWSTYKWCNGSFDTQTKYCTNSSYGTVDNKTMLDPEDDVAHVKWGGSWKMPTKEQMDELQNYCTLEWTYVNGIKGRRFTGTNGNSIFLPAAGYRSRGSLSSAGSNGVYWSRTLDSDNSDCAWYMYFDSSFVGTDYGSYRIYGRSVRPVRLPE